MAMEIRGDSSIVAQMAEGKREQQLAPFTEWSLSRGLFGGDVVLRTPFEVTSDALLRRGRVPGSTVRVFAEDKADTFTEIYIDPQGDVVGVKEYTYLTIEEGGYRIMDPKPNRELNFTGLGIKFMFIPNQERNDEEFDMVLYPREYDDPLSVDPLRLLD